jgi:CRP/FNR family transcriptional regulator, anaerobic regulatory protein
MMNIHANSGASAARWQPSYVQPALKLERDERWSDFAEVLNLLRFDGHVHEANDGTLFRRRRLKAGQSALSMGQAFEGLYVVRLGALKTWMTHVDGGEHVIAFPMKGDLLGSDGICQGKYLSEVVALTDCDLIRIPADKLFCEHNGCNDLERMAYWAVSREIVQEQSAYALTYSPKSEVRVAHFLHIQSERFAAMGYSPNQFILPMTRRDIGNYLNVTLETVSRAFSALRREGIIAVERRQIRIFSHEALLNFGA